MPFEGTRIEGTLYFLNQIEKLNRIANQKNRKRPATPINKSGAHIVVQFFDGQNYCFSSAF